MPERKQFSEAVKDRPGAGRYQAVHRATKPAQGVARPMPSENVRTALVAVPDPFDPKQRIQATANRLVDILETERSHGRIKEDAYRIGRVIQEIYEGRRGSERTMDRVDVSRTPGDAAVTGLMRAERVVALEAHLKQQVGELGARFLRAVISEGVTFERYAAMTGKAGKHGSQMVAGRFRMMLKDLAASWAAVG